MSVSIPQYSRFQHVPTEPSHRHTVQFNRSKHAQKLRSLLINNLQLYFIYTIKSFSPITVFLSSEISGFHRDASEYSWNFVQNSEQI